ncbi:MAG: phosphatase PAP2 family protein [Heliobacteriaceae bacterium]|nr:phosphatase PAP2 family protein [Heliobacteriaceae bacterium]MDD4588601.1 phosphatase PAP2 family protein [Heliobacteriaceae bacterium]
MKQRPTVTPPAKLGRILAGGIAAGVLFLMVFAELAEGVLYDELETFDTVVGNFVRSFAGDGLTKANIFVTYLGSAYVEISVMLLVGGFLLFRWKHIGETVILFSSLAGAELLNAFLKVIFQRSRPDITHLVAIGGFSFPSGHAMVAMSFYGVLGYLLWLNFRERSKPAWYVIGLTVVLIVAIGLSRIYLGVHFPSDVLAGFAAGGVWMIACILGLHTIRYYKSRQ